MQLFSLGLSFRARAAALFQQLYFCLFIQVLIHVFHQIGQPAVKESCFFTHWVLLNPAGCRQLSVSVKQQERAGGKKF